MDLQQTIGMYRQKWIRKGQWRDPSINDALDFAVEEMGEAFSCFNKMKRGYVRNNPINGLPNGLIDSLAIEIFDAIMMLVITLDLLGYNLNDVAKRKLEEMDKKRNGIPNIKTQEMS